MTAKRLEELKKKFQKKEGDIQDLGELLCDFFQSQSIHTKEIKGQISEVLHNQEVIYNTLDSIRELLNPVYTIISSDENDPE